VEEDEPISPFVKDQRTVKKAVEKRNSLNDSWIEDENQSSSSSSRS
jgi:hypothetical protein